MSEEAERPEQNVEIQEALVKTAKPKDFTSEDKKTSEIKEWVRFVEWWFKKHEWLAYNREKKNAFCSTCST